MATVASLFNSEVGGINSTAYVTLQKFNDYFTVSYGRSDILSLSDDLKMSLIIDSTRLIDRGYTFIGSKVSKTQSLEFPRYIYSYDVSEDTSSARYMELSKYFNGSSTLIPSKLADAVMELSYKIFKEGSISTGNKYSLKDTVKLGNISIKYKNIQERSDIIDATSINHILSSYYKTANNSSGSLGLSSIKIIV